MLNTYPFTIYSILVNLKRLVLNKLLFTVIKVPMLPISMLKVMVLVSEMVSNSNTLFPSLLINMIVSIRRLVKLTKILLMDGLLLLLTPAKMMLLLMFNNGLLILVTSCWVNFLVVLSVLTVLLLKRLWMMLLDIRFIVKN